MLLVRGYRRSSAALPSVKMSNIPRMLLFDIDGTLTQSHFKDAATRHPMAKALSLTFGGEIRRRNVSFAGGTDGSIIRDLMQANGVTEGNTCDYQDKVKETYRILPGIMREGVSEGSFSWSALPNVHTLLDKLSKMEGARLALLTGNIVENARIKLESASINVSLFEVATNNKNGEKKPLGAFGSDHEIRSKLVPVAQKRYADLIGAPVSAGDMVVIGDTPKDIACAHDNGVPCVAVTYASSRFTPEDLADADCVLENGFGDIDESIKAIMETRYKRNLKA